MYKHYCKNCGKLLDRPHTVGENCDCGAETNCTGYTTEKWERFSEEKRQEILLSMQDSPFDDMWKKILRILAWVNVALGVIVGIIRWNYYYNELCYSGWIGFFVFLLYVGVTLFFSIAAEIFLDMANDIRTIRGMRK